VRVQDTADIWVSNNFRQFAALSERISPRPSRTRRQGFGPALRTRHACGWKTFLLRGVLAARFHVGAYLTGVEAADEVIALSPRRI